MDLPLIYNPKIKSIQTKKNKKNRSLIFGANAEQDIIFSYFISAHTVQLKGKEERFIFYHFQENMILSLPVDCVNMIVINLQPSVVSSSLTLFILTSVCIFSI